MRVDQEAPPRQSAISEWPDRDPVTEQQTVFPSPGLIVGIYARNDFDTDVCKSAANHMAALATRFEFLVNEAEHDVLNPEHLNIPGYFSGGGRSWETGQEHPVTGGST